MRPFDGSRLWRHCGLCYSLVSTHSVKAWINLLTFDLFRRHSPQCYYDSLLNKIVVVIRVQIQASCFFGVVDDGVDPVLVRIICIHGSLQTRISLIPLWLYPRVERRWQSSKTTVQPEGTSGDTNSVLLMKLRSH